MASETCFSSAGSAQQRDNELFTLREDVGLLDKEALVNTGDDAQETENVSFLSKPKVFNRSLCLVKGETVKLGGNALWKWLATQIDWLPEWVRRTYLICLGLLVPRSLLVISKSCCKHWNLFHFVSRLLKRVKPLLTLLLKKRREEKRNENERKISHFLTTPSHFS